MTGSQASRRATATGLVLPAFRGPLEDYEAPDADSRDRMTSPPGVRWFSFWSSSRRADMADWSPVYSAAFSRCHEEML